MPQAEKQKMDESSSESSSFQLKSAYASKVSRCQYLDERTADVHFICDDGRVPTHRSVLSKASKVFDAMFYGSMAMTGDVPLPGKSSDAFKILLQFCYLDEVALRLDCITDVMALLNEYQMFECLELCTQFWSANWSIDNICSAYDWAIN